MRENYAKLKRAIEAQKVPFRILYAMKANSGTAVLKILKKEGAFIDAVSANEALRALGAGFPAEKIMFTGAWNSEQELETLLAKKITLNIDSLDDLDEVLAKTGGKPPGILSFRVNGDFGAGHSHHTITGGVDSQFGIWQDRIIGAYSKAKAAGVEKFGMHCHIGSGVLESGEFLKAANVILEFARRAREKLGIRFEFLDFGGGLGVPYKPEQMPLDLENHFSELCALFTGKVREFDLGNPVFAIEPGRFLVCDAEVMLATARSVKETPGKKFCRTDLAMNDLLRHAMYGSYHHILVDGKIGRPESQTYTVTGTICETGDRIATGRKLPKLQKGDLLAVLNTGAYGYSMGSEYNSRSRAPVVLIDGKKETLVSRRGGLKDLLRLEVHRA